MTEEKWSEFLLGLPNTWQDTPFGEDVLVYKVGRGEDAKMFALIKKNSKPVNISLKCDPSLAKLLREKYETVQEGYHLNKRHWNTIICSGQLPDEELISLARHSYELVSAKNKL